MDENTDYLLKCREAIEKKLAWGDPSGWQGLDFENLSEQIFNETDVVLSTSTLKRVWGKVRYDSKPNLSTLDALARFIGYANWRAFTAATPPPAISDPLPRKRFPAGRGILLFLLAAAGILLTGLALTRKTSKKLSYAHIRFSSKPVTRGVPNTVIFEYDAGQSNADSVFIQQSWDPKRRFKVDKNLHTYTSTYYMPGFYKAKLILNDSIVKEHDLIIESGGWMGAISQEPEPLYLKERIFKPGGVIGLTEGDLQQLKIDVDTKAPNLVLTNVSNGFNVHSNNFLLSIELQNTYNHNNAICRKSSIMLTGTGGVIIIPLSKLGCIGEMGMLLGNKQISGQTNDLSGLGVDFSKPVLMQCRSLDDRIQITINGKAAFEDSFKEHIGNIVGIRVAFEGIGSIQSFRLKPAR